MAKATQLLSVLGRINPAIYDFIFPHGPVLSRAVSGLSRVADELNPDQLRQLRSRLQREFAVEHITLQIEPVGFHECSDQALEHCESRPAV